MRKGDRVEGESGCWEDDVSKCYFLFGLLDMIWLKGSVCLLGTNYLDQTLVLQSKKIRVNRKMQDNRQTLVFQSKDWDARRACAIVEIKLL